jgi:hypothetical protein
VQGERTSASKAISAEARSPSARVRPGADRHKRPLWCRGVIALPLMSVLEERAAIVPMGAGRRQEAGNSRGKVETELKGRDSGARALGTDVAGRVACRKTKPPPDSYLRQPRFG